MPLRSLGLERIEPQNLSPFFWLRVFASSVVTSIWYAKGINSENYSNEAGSNLHCISPAVRSRLFRTVPDAHDGDSGRCRSVFRGMPISGSGMMAIMIPG